jgi:hypothetical protein
MTSARKWKLAYAIVIVMLVVYIIFLNALTASYK